MPSEASNDVFLVRTKYYFGLGELSVFSERFLWEFLFSQKRRRARCVGETRLRRSRYHTTIKIVSFLT